MVVRNDYTLTLERLFPFLVVAAFLLLIGFIVGGW